MELNAGFFKLSIEPEGAVDELEAAVLGLLGRIDEASPLLLESEVERTLGERGDTLNLGTRLSESLALDRSLLVRRGSLPNRAA